MDFGFRVLDFGFRILDFGFWISDFGFWILDFGILCSNSSCANFGFWISDFGFWISDFGFRVLDFGFRISDFGFWILDFGFRISDFGFWILESYVAILLVQILDFGFRILDFGFWISDFGFWFGGVFADIFWMLHNRISTVHADSGRRICACNILQSDQDWMWEEEAQKANASILQEKLASLEDTATPHCNRAEFAATSMKF